MRFLFILITTLILSASIFAHPANHNNRQSSPSVIIIGAGISGIRAASLLHSEGFNVTVLEAGSRVGGRTHTVQLGGGRYTELGAEWVHGEINNTIFELVNPLGLLETPDILKKKSIITPLEFGNKYGLQNGQVLSQSTALKLEELLKYIWFDPEHWEVDVDENISEGEWARWMLTRFNEVYHISDDSNFLEAVYDWAHRTSNAESSANSWFNVSGRRRGEQYVWLEGEQNVRWKPPYNYASLSQLILTGNVTEDGIYQLPDYIRLEEEVINIKYSTNENTVTVTTLKGEELVADHVIFTPSLGVLKAKHNTMFTPNLRTRKQLVIESLGFGSVTKIALEFPQPWWPLNFEGLFALWDDIDYSNTSLQYWREDITDIELLREYDGVPLWARALLSFFNVDSGSAPNVFRTWLAGHPSRLVDQMDTALLKDHVMNVMHKFLDATFPNITEPVILHKSSWSTNPFFRGAYSYRSMASDVNDVWARDLAEPVENLATSKPLVCFAGEATHPIYFTTVHGAYETGTREAERIITWWRNNL